MITEPARIKHWARFSTNDYIIKLIKDAAGNHFTPFYDETNRDNPEKISHAIAQNFRGELTEIPEALRPYLTLAPLPSLLDFSGTSFEKQISLSSRQTLIVSSKWPIQRLGDCSEINPSKRAISGLAPGTLVSFVEMASVSNLGSERMPLTRLFYLPEHDPAFVELDNELLKNH